MLKSVKLKLNVKKGIHKKYRIKKRKYEIKTIQQ